MAKKRDTETRSLFERGAVVGSGAKRHETEREREYDKLPGVVEFVRGLPPMRWPLCWWCGRQQHERCWEWVVMDARRSFRMPCGCTCAIARAAQRRVERRTKRRRIQR